MTAHNTGEPGVAEYSFETWENRNGPKPSAGNTRPGLTLNRIGLDRRAAMQSINPCGIDGCERQAQCVAADRRVCLMHYKRWRRHGAFATTRKWSPPNADKRVCAADSCVDLEDGACGYCKLHMTRMRRHGNVERVVDVSERAIARGAEHPSWTGGQITYYGVHQRLRAARGAAGGYPCCDCGGRAAQWSYDRADSDEEQSKIGPYSASLDHYVPRCVPCHKSFDLSEGNRALA